MILHPYPLLGRMDWLPAHPRPEHAAHVKGRKHRSQKVRSNRRKAARKAKH